MARILVTGHKGFIGSYLMKILSDAEGIDLKDGKNLLTCELPDADIVIHLAGQTGVIESVNDPTYTVINNTAVTVRLLERYKNAKFILASTGGAIQEEITSPYGLSKLHCEQYVSMLHDDYRILRFSNVYGTGSRSVADKFLNQDTNVIYGDGSATRTYVAVRDLVRGILQSIDWDKGLYKFGTDQNYSVKEIAEAIGKPIVYTDAREGELLHSSVLNTTPNWKPEIDLMDYIADIKSTEKVLC